MTPASPTCAYLALRHHDNRALQAALARLGLSSLGRSEAHVLATLEQVLGMVERLATDAPTAAASFDESSTLLRRRAEALFGEGAADRETAMPPT